MDKKKMLTIGGVVLVVVLIVIGCIFLLKNGKDDTHVPNVVKKEFTVESENLDSYKYMKKMDDSNLFYLGLDEVMIDGQDLLQYLKENDIQELKKNFNRVENYKDGGSALYTCDDEKKCDQIIKILYCNTLAGDKDVYIAHKDVELTADYCNNTTEEEN